MDENTNLFDEDNSILTFTDEDGSLVQMELLDMFDYEDENYAFLVGADEEDDALLIMRYEEDGEESSFEPVEDDDLYDALFDLFRERHKDEFGFDD